MKSALYVVLALLLCTVTACKKDSTSGGGDDDHAHEVHFDEDIQPILNEIVDILNETGVFPPGLSLDSYDDLLAGWERGEVVIPYDADRSLLIELLTKVGHNSPLDAESLELLGDWINDGCEGDDHGKPFQDVVSKLYVCSQNSALINVIDPERMIVIRNIDLTLPENGGLPATCAPHHVTASPDGQYYYVSTINPDVETILKFDAGNDSLVGQISTSIPALLAHHPTENVLYASRFMNPDIVTDDIFVLDTETMTPISDGSADNGDLPVISTVPHGLAMGNDGDYVYVASLAESNLMVIRHSDKEMTHVVNLGTGKQPLQIAVSPVDPVLFVSCIGTHQMYIIDVTDPENATVTDSLALNEGPGVGMGPWHPVFSHDGSRLYVGNNGSDNAQVIDVASISILQTIDSDGIVQPHGSAISSTGDYVFISSRNVSGNYTPFFDLGDNANIGTVAAINTATNQVDKIIEIENFGSGMFLIQ